MDALASQALVIATLVGALKALKVPFIDKYLPATSLVIGAVLALIGGQKGMTMDTVYVAINGVINGAVATGGVAMVGGLLKKVNSTPNA